MIAFKAVLYSVAMIGSAMCAVLLFRAYLGSRIRLLMWSGICFVGLTLNNVALFVDLIVLPEVDLRVFRLVPALIGMLCLLYGFIWDTE